jgi:hypothetical protein
MLEWKISDITDNIATIKGTTYRIETDVKLSDLHLYNPFPKENLDRKSYVKRLN